MRCSVVFGVTLRHKHFVVFSGNQHRRYYQRCVTTCDTLAVLHRRRRLQHLPVAACTGSQARYRLRIAISAYTPPAFDAPVRGVPVGVLPSRLVRKKNLNGVG